LNNVFDGFRRQARREEGESRQLARHAARRLERPQLVAGRDRRSWQGYGDNEQRSMAAKDAEIVEGICDTPH
jgi:hypothetical protein